MLKVGKIAAACAVFALRFVFALFELLYSAK